jgi:predicted metal-dependent enzyme (double-stranded beta helix superfamily)
MLAAVEKFIREVRDVYARVDSMEERFAQIAPFLKELLTDQELNEASEKWPFRNDPSRGYIENLLFYEDPDYGFVLNSLMKKPGESTPIHDHAHTWTLYGVLRGTEKVIRFERTDDSSSKERADLKQTSDTEVMPGYIDFVRPFEIHVEHTGAEPVVGIIFRDQRVGDFLQNYYELESGKINKTKGPVQIPYSMEL